MRISFHTVSAVAALLLATGCANARLRAARQAVAPPEDPEIRKPDEVRPTWFTADGKTDGRKRRPKWTGPASPTTKDEAPPTTDRPKGRKAYPNSESPLGTNLAPVGPDSRDWVFVDVFRMASPWRIESDRPQSDSRRAPEQDPAGWVQALAPGQVAVTEVPTLNGGRFVVLYKGRGDIVIRGAKVVEQKPGRIIYQAPPRSTVRLALQTTNPSNHVRDIHVVPADFEATYEDQIFHPLFLQRLSRFSVLRFAGWGRVSQAAAPTWTQRVTPKWYTQGGPRGVAYEYMVMLANELGTDVWISVPHRANNKLVESLAAFLSDRLDPDLKVYIEYGDAFDDPTSEPSRYATKQGQFMGLDASPSAARLKYRVRRSLDVFRLFATRFDARRTFRVMSGSIDDQDGLRAMLSYKNAAKELDLLAVAPFVGVQLQDVSRARAFSGLEASDILDALEFTALPAMMSKIRGAQRVAAEFGLGLTAYSGGENLTVKAGLPGAERLDRVFDKVSRDPRSASVYAALLSGWADSGGELFVHAPLVGGYGKADRSSAMEYQEQGPANAPRYGALMAFAENRERWWGKRRPPAPDTGPTLVAKAPPGPKLDVTADPGPQSRETAIWTAGGMGLAAAAAGAIFTGLYFRSVAARDRFLADDAFPLDGQRGRDLDDQAYTYSLALTTSFSMAAVGFGSALVLDMIEEVGYDGANPGVALSASTGVLALATSATFLVAYLNTLSERSSRLDANPVPDDAIPLRNLDDEAFRWSVAAGGALAVSVASFALALSYYLIDKRDPYLESYETPLEDGDTTSGVDVLFSPTGFMLKW